VKIAQELGAALARVAAPAPIAQIEAVPITQVAPARTTTPARRRTPAPRPADPTNGAAPAGDLSLRAGERKMLAVLAQRYPMKFTRAQLGTLAGYTASGGTFGAYLGTLRRNGLVEVDGDGVRAGAGLFLSSAVSV